MPFRWSMAGSFWADKLSQPPLAEPGQDFLFGGVDNVKWRKPLVPGDVLVMEMHVTNYKKKFGICKMSVRSFVR